MAEWDWTVPMRCARCGREMFVPEKKSWVYKRNPGLRRAQKTNGNTLYFCSWGCMRAFDRQREAEGFKPHDRKYVPYYG